MAQNIISLNITDADLTADAHNDLAQLENLRPRAARLRRLLERADDGARRRSAAT